MRVYKVECDVNAFQSLAPADDSALSGDLFRFECKPKEAWAPPPMRCRDPIAPKPDFPYIQAPGALAVEPDRFPVVQTQFEMAGEILDLPFEGRDLKVLNILTCVDCLDDEKTNWNVLRSGTKLAPKTDGYVFRPDCFDEASIFKIPQTYRAMIYCWERDGDPEHELKAAIEEHQLSGLKFTLLWEG
jgi:hypothetical protein